MLHLAQKRGKYCRSLLVFPTSLTLSLPAVQSQKRHYFHFLLIPIFVGMAHWFQHLVIFCLGLTTHSFTALVIVTASEADYITPGPYDYTYIRTRALVEQPQDTINVNADHSCSSNESESFTQCDSYMDMQKSSKQIQV